MISLNLLLSISNSSSD